MSSFPKITFSWGEGRYFDYWMVAHLVGGVPFGFLALWLGYGRWSYLAATGIFVAWEIFEIFAKTPEAWENRAVDVLVALVGFAVAYELGTRASAGLLVAITGGISAALNLAGWWLRGK